MKTVISQNSKGYFFETRFRKQVVAFGGYYETFKECEAEAALKENVKNYYVIMSKKGMAKFNKILKEHVDKSKLKDWSKIGIRSTWRHVDSLKYDLIKDFTKRGVGHLKLWRYNTISKQNESFEFDESCFSLIFIKHA